VHGDLKGWTANVQKQSAPGAAFQQAYQKYISAVGATKFRSVWHR
jgi:hypothetical protein